MGGKRWWVLGAFVLGAVLASGSGSAGRDAADGSAACVPGGACQCPGGGDDAGRCLQSSVDACRSAGGRLRSEEGKGEGAVIRLHCDAVSRTAPPPVADVPLAARRPADPGMAPRCGTSQVCTCTGGVHRHDPYICMGNMANLCLASGGIPNVDGVMPPSSAGGDITIYMSCWPKP